jgi:hypothetical protein
VLAKSKRLHG